jgi:hypothetical protein
MSIDLYNHSVKSLAKRFGEELRGGNAHEAVRKIEMLDNILRQTPHKEGGHVNLICNIAGLPFKLNSAACSLLMPHLSWEYEKAFKLYDEYVNTSNLKKLYGAQELIEEMTTPLVIETKPFTKKQFLAQSAIQHMLMAREDLKDCVGVIQVAWNAYTWDDDATSAEFFDIYTPMKAHTWDDGKLPEELSVTDTRAKFRHGEFVQTLTTTLVNSLTLKPLDIIV